VVRIDLDKESAGLAPEQGKRDKHGEVIDDRIYNQRGLRPTLVLEQRTQLVARKVTEFLKATRPLRPKTIHSSAKDIDHAERMRQALVNENEDLSSANRKYRHAHHGDKAPPRGRPSWTTSSIRRAAPVIVTRRS